LPIKERKKTCAKMENAYKIIKEIAEDKPQYYEIVKNIGEKINFFSKRIYKQL